MLSFPSIRAAVNDAAAPPAREAEAPCRGSLPGTHISHGLPLLVRLGGLPVIPVRARRAPAPAKGRPARRSPASGYAVPKTASKKTSANDPLAFLKDPRLSIEDKLIKLLGYMGKKWEKEMQEKLDEIAASEAEAKKASASKSSSSKKGGGLLGSLGSVLDAVKSVVSPAGLAFGLPVVGDLLKQVGGPVLAMGAAALGLPAVAPLLIELGPDVAGMAAGFLSALDGKGASGGSKSGGSRTSGGGSGSSGAARAMTDAERQMLLMEIQRIQQKQQEMFGLVSNVLKSNHDVRQGVINNIR